MAKKISVSCGVSSGVVMRLYRKPIREGEPAMPDPEYDPVTLRAGNNHDIDAGFFAAWIEQNRHLAETLNISAQDDQPKE